VGNRLGACPTLPAGLAIECEPKDVERLVAQWRGSEVWLSNQGLFDWVVGPVPKVVVKARLGGLNCLCAFEMIAEPFSLN